MIMIQYTPQSGIVLVWIKHLQLSVTLSSMDVYGWTARRWNIISAMQFVYQWVMTMRERRTDSPSLYIARSPCQSSRASISYLNPLVTIYSPYAVSGPYLLPTCFRCREKFVDKKWINSSSLCKVKARCSSWINVFFSVPDCSPFKSLSWCIAYSVAAKTFPIDSLWTFGRAFVLGT